MDSKQETCLQLLETSSVFIHLDPRVPSVSCPEYLRKQPHLVLQVGLNMAIPIPDLAVEEYALTCTLSFGGRKEFCIIPWKAVFGIANEAGDKGKAWPEDMPQEVKDAQRLKAKQAAKPVEQPVKPKSRGHLRLVK